MHLVLYIKSFSVAFVLTVRFQAPPPIPEHEETKELGQRISVIQYQIQ